MEYIDAFYSGLVNILPFTNQGQQAFFFMLVGIFIGFWVGILPGLGGAATLALMLPFIYKMDPTSAFAFLLAVPEPAQEPQIVMLNSPVYRPLFAFFFVALFAYLLRKTILEIRPMEERAALFPMVLSIPCLALALLAFGQELYSTLHRTTASTNIPEIPSSLEPAVVLSRAISIVAWTLGFFLAIWLLGFLIAVPVTIFLYLRFAGGEKWSLSILSSLIAGVVFYGLFDYLLHLPFPEGTLWVWLNLSG